MSNSVSTAQTAGKQQTHPIIPQMGAGQRQFNTGTIKMLDEARGVVENAIGQGQQLNPQIYQMLGLEPTYEDHTQDLTAAQGELDAAQKQFNAATSTLETLKGIPQGKRTPDQKKQFRQLTKQLPQLKEASAKATNIFAQLQTNPKTITGFTRLDPKDIPAESPFSAANGLNQAQQAETGRLNQYLQGGEVDPTLKHQYDAAEQALRAKLTARFGPDYEGTSVGQMALQNFARQKNEAFATWNQQQVEAYNNMAFQGQSNLQNLLTQRIGMLQEPANNQINAGTQLSNMAGARLQQQGTVNQWLLGHGGVSTNTTGFGGGGSGGGLIQGLFAPGPNGGPSVAGGAYNALTTGHWNPNGPAAPESVPNGYSGGGALSSWAANGADAGIAGEAAGATGAGATGAELQSLAAA